MDRRWRVLALCGFSFFELRAQQSPSASTQNMTNATSASMRGAVARARSWQHSVPNVTLAVIENEEHEDRGRRPVRRPLLSTRSRGVQPLFKPPSGAFLEDSSSFGPDESSRRLYGLPERDSPYNTDWFRCETKSCGIHDKFYELTDWRTKAVSEDHQCSGVMPKELKTFTDMAWEQCPIYARQNLEWRDCRSMYCDMYEKIVTKVTNRSEYYLGGDCAQLLSFNKSICLSYYRDSSSFCDCMCPALRHLEATPDCKTDIIAYLTLGRRGGALLKRFPMSPLCSTYFCKWMEDIADPRKQTKGAPKQCLDFQLPFVRSQCINLMAGVTKSPGEWKADRSGMVFSWEYPYNPCPWDKAGDKDFIMTCTDGYTCDVRVESWACCQRHAQRMHCPRNFPVMCRDPLECVGESDHCCVEEEANCASGIRLCSPLMAPDMIEWTGKVPPGVPAYIGPTTTMSLRDFKLWLSRQPKPTTQPESWGEDAMPFLPFIIASAFVVLICMAFVACYCFGKDTWKNFANTLFGAGRFMTLMQTDIVNLFHPAEAPREWPELPPRISDEDRRRMEADKMAMEALADACREAFSYGRIHLVSVHFASGMGPRKQAANIRAAVADVRARSLQEEGDNPELIEEGLKWCDILSYEIGIVEALEKAYPSMTVDFSQLTTPPVAGAPWKGTTVGHAVDCDERRKVWKTIEELMTAIKIAENGGASTGLTESGHELLNTLIARTPELPADRCVLDPEGKGVRVLPEGRQRGLWRHTGEAYLYAPDKANSATEVNDFELPPGENLVGTSVAPARPVCASYAKQGNCKLGKRCPWRHCKPIKGDAIREPIYFS